MLRKKLSRRQITTGVTGLAAATILHWPADAAEYSWKYGSVLPITPISGALQMYSLSGDILAPRNPAGGIMSVGFAFPGYGQNWAAMDGDLGVWYRDLAAKQGLFALERTRRMICAA
jgi:hypothetical protein